MIHVLNCFRNILKNEFGYTIYIDKSTNFKRPSFYITIGLSSEPLNMFYKQNTYDVTIRYFGPLSEQNIASKMNIYETLEKFNNAVGNKVEYKGNYMRITDRNFSEDSMGDLIIRLTVEAEDYKEVFGDVEGDIIQNININKN